MRFLEKHWRTILDGKESPITKAVIPIDVSEAAKWYFEEAEVYEQTVRSQFPTVVCPWPVMFVEYRIPPKWKAKVGDGWKMMNAPHGPSDFFGMLIIQEELGANYTGADPAEGKVLGDLASKIEDAKPAYYKQTTFFFAGNQQDRDVLCWCENYVQRDGRMLGGPLRNVSSKIIDRAKMMTDVDAYGDILRTYGYPIYFALSLWPSSQLSTVYADTLTDSEFAKKARRDGIAFNYSTQRVTRTGKIDEALAQAAQVWTHQDKGTYVTFMPGHKTWMEQIKTHQFKI
jgi:hypothetical protein